MKWEHMIHVISTPRANQEALVERLNAYGTDGWELVVLRHLQDSGPMSAYEVVFKRPLP